MRADPIALLEQITPEAIAARLAELERERLSLLPLLRAARARDRRRPGPRPPRRGGAAPVR